MDTRWRTSALHELLSALPIVSRPICLPQACTALHALRCYILGTNLCDRHPRNSLLRTTLDPGGWGCPLAPAPASLQSSKPIQAHEQIVLPRQCNMRNERNRDVWNRNNFCYFLTMTKACTRQCRVSSHSGP